MALLTRTVITEAAFNWEKLAQKIRKNESDLRVGDVITEQTKDGEELDLVVVDMGPGWARFESKDCLPLEVPYNQSGRNAGGFAESGVKWHLDNWHLNNTVFASLPEELQAVISEIERTQEGGKTYRCRLFLPTESEVFGNCNYSGDDTYPQIEYYKDRRHRIKCNKKGGTPDYWWLASVTSGFSTGCVSVDCDGISSNRISANVELCVPVCFIIQ